jgi:hypothetical protein
MLHGPGYDGQFFAALATDPLLLNAATPAYLDAPAYRAGRIGLPLAAWVLAGGEKYAAILIYQLLCWAGAVLGVWVAARWLVEGGASPLWALPLGISGGVVASVVRSLPDATAASLILLALWLRNNERRGAIAVLAFACLVRETSLIAAIALIAFDVRAKRYGAAAIAFVPFLVVSIWWLWVASRPGVPGVPPVPPVPALGAPMIGVWEKLLHPVSVVELVGTAAIVLAVAATIPLRRSWSPVALTYFGFAAMTACLSYFVTIEFLAYGRATAVLPLAATVVFPSLPSRSNKWIMRAVPLAFAVLGTAALANYTRFAYAVRAVVM